MHRRPVTNFARACDAQSVQSIRVRTGRTASLAHRLGMGLGEMLLTLSAIAILLGVLMMVSNTLRTENAYQQTVSILRSLRLGLTQYHSLTSTYPPGPTSVAIHYLQRLPECETHLRGLRLRADREGFMTIDDGYGRPLRYIAPADQRLRIGDFVSAGPDGLFGDHLNPDARSQNAMLDNIYSSHLSIPAP
jgi:hypothetical protein